MPSPKPELTTLDPKHVAALNAKIKLNPDKRQRTSRNQIQELAPGAKRSLDRSLEIRS